MLSVEEALEEILGLLSPLPAVEIPLEESLGLVLQEEIAARESHPEHDTSAMDGYAVLAGDIAEASLERPVILPVQQDIAAGVPAQSPLEVGRVCRISTGALIPTGADAVVMREDVEVVDGGSVSFRSPVKAGANIRTTGEHVRQGEVVLSPGMLLRPAHLSMGAYLGFTHWRCTPRPKVAILSTGSELVEAGVALGKGQVRDSNSVALMGALRELGCEVVLRERVPDSPEALDEALARAFALSDLLLTSGGISAGWHDHVRNSIEKRQGVFLFHKLKMRPGKPLGFGRCRDTVFFCLPGNPVSSMVTFELFVKPALAKLTGQPYNPTTKTATLVQKVHKKPGAAIYFRGVALETPDGLSVRLTGPQGSHMLRSLVEANVLIRTREEDGDLPAGTEVEVLPYYA